MSLTMESMTRLKGTTNAHRTSAQKDAHHHDVRVASSKTSGNFQGVGIRCCNKGDTAP